MAIELEKSEIKEIVASLQRYCREELELELGEMRAKFLLDYVLEEIAPLAYNQGVKDAGNFLRVKLEDLPGTCFEDGLTYWATRKSKR
jgi:uncharacterized protein (DUF2164 family)